MPRLSAYDPRDLFSGRPARMAAALAALLADPQNNLRLFWRGAPLRPPLGGPADAEALAAVGGAGGLVGVLVAVLRAERAPLARGAWRLHAPV